MSEKERLKIIIDFYKMSIRAFSKHIGCKSPQVLYDINNGRNGFSKDLAEKIHAKCVNINLAWIMTGEGEMLKEVSHNNSITNDYSGASIQKLNTVNSRGDAFVSYTADVEETYSLKNTVNRLEAEIESLKHLLALKDEIISEKERHIRLLLKSK